MLAASSPAGEPLLLQPQPGLLPCIPPDRVGDMRQSSASRVGPLHNRAAGCAGNVVCAALCAGKTARECCCILFSCSALLAFLCFPFRPFCAVAFACCLVFSTFTLLVLVVNREATPARAGRTSSPTKSLCSHEHHMPYNYTRDGWVIAAEWCALRPYSP